MTNPEVINTKEYSEVAVKVKDAFALYTSARYKEALEIFDELCRANAAGTTSYRFIRDLCLQQISEPEGTPDITSIEEEVDDQLREEIETIQSQGLFDAEYYRNSYPDLSQFNDNECIIHYCRYGYKEDRRPIDGFYPNYYLQRLKEKGITVEGNPLLFFARKEKRERDSRLTGAFLYPDWRCKHVGSVHFDPESEDFESDAAFLRTVRIAVFCHVHYLDAVEPTLANLNCLSSCADFHFTSTSESTLSSMRGYYQKNFNKGDRSAIFTLYPNKGRDMLPFVTALKQSGEVYDYILKVHGKRSADSEIISGNDWRDHCLQNLVGSASNVKTVIKAFENDQRLGVLYPPHFQPVFQYCTWGSSLEVNTARDLHDSLLLDRDKEKIIDFPSGSMFWARPEAIAYWIQLIDPDKVEPEPLPRDGTSLHFFERAIPYALNAAGFGHIQHINRSYTTSVEVRTTPLVQFKDIIKWKVKQTKGFSEDALAGKINLNLNHPSPVCSIVIPVYKNYMMTLQCLCSIYLAKEDAPIEVIVVDDCSPEHLNIPLSRYGVTVIRNQQNLGFVGSCNAGAALAKGRSIVFLNNDTIVLNNWLEPLLEMLDTPDVGIVGSMLVYPDGSLQEAGGCIWQDGNGLNYGRNDNPNDPKYNFTREADYCSGASLAIRTSDFRELGGFDIDFSPGYYEDTDLCFKTRQSGKRIIYEPRSKVIHLEGKSSEDSPTGGMKKHQEINKTTFVRRWSNVLLRHTKPHQDRFFHNRSKKAKVLVLDSFLPTPDKDSGSNDLVLAMQIFDNAGFEVTFMPTWEVGFNPRYLDLLQKSGVRVYTQEYQYHCPEWIRSLNGEFNLCMILRYDNFHRFANIVRDVNPGIKLVFDTVDLHYVREGRQSSHEGNGASHPHIANLKAAEFQAINGSEHTFVRSEFELNLLRESPSVASNTVSILPICREIHRPCNQFDQRDGILFVGGFKHSPNLDAVRYFIEDVYPKIQAIDSMIKITIAGSHSELLRREVSGLDQPNICIIGYVEDLTATMESYRLSMAPLRFGAGTKGKVISSFCHGLPCVATSVASEGMVGVQEGHHLLIQDNPDDFARACVRLHNDPVLWDLISKNSLDYAQDNASISAMSRHLLNPVSRLLAMDAHDNPHAEPRIKELASLRHK